MILGLDISLTGTGAVVMDDGGMLRCRKLISPDAATGKKGTDWNRLDEIRSEVMKLHEEWSPGLVVIEDLALSSRTGKALERAGLHYLIRDELRTCGGRVLLVSPGSLKKFVLGKGTGKKELIIREIFRRWMIIADDDNVADAVVLAKIGQCVLDLTSAGGGQDWYKPQLEVAGLLIKNGLDSGNPLGGVA